jgi:hypothetical protein
MGAFSGYGVLKNASISSVVVAKNAFSVLRPCGRVVAATAAIVVFIIVAALMLALSLALTYAFPVAYIVVGAVRADDCGTTTQPGLNQSVGSWLIVLGVYQMVMITLTTMVNSCVGNDPKNPTVDRAPIQTFMIVADLLGSIFLLAMDGVMAFPFATALPGCGG